MNKLTVSNIKIEDKRITVSFNCTGQIRKFFIKNNFIAEYDTSIEKVPEAILIIPFLATIAPIAWANNADVFVKTADATFLSSLNEVRKTLQRFYPKMKFRGNIHSENIISPQVEEPTRKMMLFSGGIDSLATFIRHQDENPILVSIQESDFSIGNKEKVQNAGEMNISMNISTKYLKEFSGTSKSENRLIVSNWIFVPDNFMLGIFQGKLSGEWYTRVMHGLAFSGLCAPLSYTENVDKLYIASSYTADAQIPWGSHPDIDNNTKWTGTTVEHDGYELSRQQKMFLIADYINSRKPKLQICSCTNECSRKLLNVDVGKNCSHCEKCSRTILGLELAGIDPNKHGFTVDAETFSYMKTNLENRSWRFGDDEVYMWTDIQKHSTNMKEIPHQEAKELLEWLRSVDIESYRVKPGRARRVDPIFKILPYPAFKVTKRLYMMFNEKIQ